MLAICCESTIPIDLNTQRVAAVLKIVLRYAQHMSSAAPTPPAGMLLGYARGPQPLVEAQVDALSAVGVDSARVYREVDDSADRQEGRPALAALIDYARTGDTVVVTGLDRLGRSSSEALSTISEFRERGLDLWTTRERVDSREKVGAMIVGVLASLAMLDAESVRSASQRRRPRAHSGRSAIGRPRSLSREQVALAERLRDAGDSVPTIAASLGVSRATLYRSLAEKQVTQ